MRLSAITTSTKSTPAAVTGTSSAAANRSDASSRRAFDLLSVRLIGLGTASERCCDRLIITIATYPHPRPTTGRHLYAAGSSKATCPPGGAPTQM